MQWASSPNFKRFCKDNVRRNTPTILGFVEPRISGKKAEIVATKLGFGDYLANYSIWSL